MDKVLHALGKAIGYLLGIVLIIVFLVGLFDIVIGVFELAWWFITGEFFHFVNIEPPSVF